ncbi:uncharacterized protein LOC135936833 [Cloeon dipterum]|uniref:uncharacterized protein LOC135936833 n=1 Tax=Cloeon dipterum TaxID=197152 RepID=UPI00321FCB8E
MEEIKRIVEEGEKMPERPANLGYFVSQDQTRTNADNVCVLVVHYNFENAKNKNLHRKGDAQDVKNLERTFRVNRNCNFRSILSPEKGQLLQLLANQEELLRLFGSSEVPSVFVLYILSHGYRDGIIFTDHYQNEDPNDLIYFTTAEIFDSLKKLTGFEDCLKLLNFGPCRGELGDEVFVANNKIVPFKNENSCRITYSPLMRNTVVFFSTVETTRAKRNQSGTTFTFLTCQVLNSLEQDESLINVLANIQNESHKNVDFVEKKYTGQTPEVKMFSQDRSFFFSKSPSIYSAPSTSDAMGIKNKKKREFYSWKSSSGVNLRHRIAFLFSAEPNEQLKEIKRALSQNLDFETSERMLSGKPWASINEASRLDSDIGCVFLFLFGRLIENKDMKEVCVQVDSRETAVSEILREFIGPKNDQWIGKPKILFLVNLETSSFDYEIPLRPKMEISATNHSGWLVLVLHNKEELQKLIEIFKGQELKKEKSLQELLASLLISDSIESRDLLNSTLQYLLNFPDWPRSFVKLNFSVKYSQQSQKKNFSFDSLIKDSATKKQTWLLSSDAGSGKTTILREMAFQLGKLHPELKILRVSLPKVSFSTLKRNFTDIEFLVKATHNSHEEITKSIENKQCVVFLDGFDETENQEIILKVIDALEKKQISVWVGTRPHAAEAIQKWVTNAVLVKIEPLNQEQQIELLQQETGMRKGDCEEFIANFTSKDILENPLHLSLVAKYGAEGNLYQIYDQVVRHKVEDSLIREGYDKNNVNTFQRKLNKALESLQQIASCHIRGVEIIGENSKDLVKINCYGIATFENNRVDFIHQTFAEFLAAQYFLRVIEDGDDFQTTNQDAANLFLGEWFSWCRKFVDLFYSTVLTDEAKIEEHRASILPIVKLNPDRFMELIARNGCTNIFTMIEPVITFGNNQEGNCISVVRDKALLVKAMDGEEEIAMKLLDKDLINSDDELLILLPYLLKSVARSNATLFFEKLKTKYPRLPEMIRSRRLSIDAAVMAARNNSGEILDLLLQSGVDVDTIDKNEGNTLYCAISKGAMKCVEILLKHGAKLAKDVSGNSWDPLMVAVKENQLDLVKYFLEENISGLQRNKETFEINEVKTDLNALQFSIHRGHKEIAKFLIEKSPSLKNVDNGKEGSLLQISAKKGYLGTCQWLVDEAEVDVNTLRPSGESKDWSFWETKYMDHLLILQKSDINKTDERGKTALHCSAEYGYLESVQDLIQSGANVQAQDDNGWNAFHFACKSSSDHKEKIIRLLHGTDCQLAKEKTKSGQTGLHILLKFSYFSVEKVRFLVEEIGVDVKAKDNNGCSALQFALSKGMGCVNYLMRKDINLEVKNKWGQACLHLAAVMGDLEALQTWIDLGGDLDVVDNYGLTALHYAANEGHLQFVKKLLVFAAKEAKNPDIGEGSAGSTQKKRVNRFDNSGTTALHLAVKSKNVDMVKMLLESNADLTLTGMEGNNAIHYAINSERMLRFIHEKNGSLLKQALKNESTLLHLALHHNYVLEDSDKIYKWIVEQEDDTDLNVKNASGDTPLLHACKHMIWSVAEMLLTRNVEVNVQDTEGKTAMHYAAEKGKLNLVKLMHEKGANFALTDDDGMNTLHSATGYFEIFIFLHEKNDALLKQRLKNGDTTLHCAIRSSYCTKLIKWLIEQCQIDLNSTNSGGETPLLLACTMRRWMIAKMLLEKSVDVHVKDKIGKTALHYAVNSHDGLEDLHAFDVVQELCKRGADLASTDNDGKNAFHHAMKNFHMALFIHELNGELVKQRLNNGDTTLHLAIKSDLLNRNQALIMWLLEQDFVDLNARNALNETPLILACKASLYTWKIVEILLSQNVDVNVRDDNGKSARDFVEEFVGGGFLKRFDEIVASRNANNEVEDRK